MFSQFSHPVVSCRFSLTVVTLLLLSLLNADRAYAQLSLFTDDGHVWHYYTWNRNLSTPDLVLPIHTDKVSGSIATNILGSVVVADRQIQTYVWPVDDLYARDNIFRTVKDLRSENSIQYDVYDIDWVPTSTRCVGVGSKNDHLAFFRSDDSGLTWLITPTIFSTRSGPGSIRFVGSVGLASQDKLVFRSDDAGASWINVLQQDPSNWFNGDSVTSVALYNGSLAALVVYSGKTSSSVVYISTDDGFRYWNQLDELMSLYNKTPQINHFFFVNGTTWLVATKQVLWRTVDAGQTWHQALDESEYGTEWTDIIGSSTDGIVAVGRRAGKFGVLATSKTGSPGEWKVFASSSAPLFLDAAWGDLGFVNDYGRHSSSSPSTLPLPLVLGVGAGICVVVFISGSLLGALLGALIARRYYNRRLSMYMAVN